MSNSSQQFDTSTLLQRPFHQMPTNTAMCAFTVSIHSVGKQGVGDFPGHVRGSDIILLCRFVLGCVEPNCSSFEISIRVCDLRASIRGPSFDIPFLLAEPERGSLAEMILPTRAISNRQLNDAQSLSRPAVYAPRSSFVLGVIRHRGSPHSPFVSGSFYCALHLAKT
jgi:hypothetical protein